RVQVEADVALLDRVGIDVRVGEDRLEVRRLVVDPRRADALALQVLRVAYVGAGKRDDRGQRLVDEGADGDHAQALVPRAEQLRLVGDREVNPPGRDVLDRRRRIRRLADLHLEPGLLEV